MAELAPGYTFQTWTPAKGHPQAATLSEIRVLSKGEIVGGIRLLEGKMEGVLHIALLKVDKAHRHKGLATELHRRALEVAATKGLHLRAVGKLNPKLNPLWDKLKENRRAAEGGDIKTGAGSESPSPEEAASKSPSPEEAAASEG